MQAVDAEGSRSRGKIGPWAQDPFLPALLKLLDRIPSLLQQRYQAVSAHQMAGSNDYHIILMIFQARSQLCHPSDVHLY